MDIMKKIAGYALMAIYLALDGYGPAVNVSGDGAITVIADAIFGNKKVTVADEA